MSCQMGVFDVSLIRVAFFSPQLIDNVEDNNTLSDDKGAKKDEEDYIDDIYDADPDPAL